MSSPALPPATNRCEIWIYAGLVLALILLSEVSQLRGPAPRDAVSVTSAAASHAGPALAPRPTPTR